jgi:hypothetical protein
MRRKALVSMYEQHQDLYGRGWEVAETSFIREECEAMDLPMGYGRVGRAPHQLTWGVACAPDPRVDWKAFDDGVESEDGQADVSG